MGFGIKRRINDLLLKVGYTIVPVGDVRPLVYFFAALKKANFQPKLIYDIGANHGNWTRSALNYFPTASYVLLEPQDRLKSAIGDLIQQGFNIEWINAGAGSEPGTQWFTISSRDDSSSFINKNVGAKPDLDQVKMEVTTLNELVSKRGGAVPELVKIDAEGWDLKVLEGASNLIGITDIFMIEATVCARGTENTVLATMQKFDQLGYSLIDITDLNHSPKSGLLWLTELVFLRRGCPLLDGAVNYE